MRKCEGPDSISLRHGSRELVACVLTKIIVVLTPVRHLGFPEDRPVWYTAERGTFVSEDVMGKGNSRRGNKETKKPKQEKPKVSATAGSATGPVSLGEKKRR